MMKLYHGISDVNLKNIRKNGIETGSWFCVHKFHGLRIADRTCNKVSGTPILLEFEILSDDIERVCGRGLPTFKLVSNKSYKPCKIHVLKELDINSYEKGDLK